MSNTIACLHNIQVKLSVKHNCLLHKYLNQYRNSRPSSTVMYNQTCQQRPLRGLKKVIFMDRWFYNTGELTVRIATFGTLKEQSLNTGGFYTHLVLRTGSTVLLCCTHTSCVITTICAKRNIMLGHVNSFLIVFFPVK